MKFHWKIISYEPMKSATMQIDIYKLLSTHAQNTDRFNHKLYYSHNN